MSTEAYTLLGGLGAYAISTRRKLPPGRPVALVHVAPWLLEYHAFPSKPEAMAFELLVGSKSTSVTPFPIPEVSTAANVAPASRLRYNPVWVAARMMLPSGEIATRF